MLIFINISHLHLHNFDCDLKITSTILLLMWRRSQINSLIACRLLHLYWLTIISIINKRPVLNDRSIFTEYEVGLEKDILNNTCARLNTDKLFFEYLIFSGLILSHILALFNHIFQVMFYFQLAPAEIELKFIRKYILIFENHLAVSEICSANHDAVPKYVTAHFCLAFFLNSKIACDLCAVFTP